MQLSLGNSSLYPDHDGQRVRITIVFGKFSLSINDLYNRALRLCFPFKLCEFYAPFYPIDSLSLLLYSLAFVTIAYVNCNCMVYLLYFILSHSHNVLSFIVYRYVKIVWCFRFPVVSLFSYIEFFSWSNISLVASIVIASH